MNGSISLSTWSMRSAAKSSAIVAQPGARPPGTTTRPVRTWRTSVPTGPVARLARRAHRNAQAAQALGEPRDVGRRPGAIDALEDHESSALRSHGADPLAHVAPDRKTPARQADRTPARRARLEWRRVFSEDDVVDEPRRADAARDARARRARPSVSRRTRPSVSGIANLDVVDRGGRPLDRLAGPSRSSSRARSLARREGARRRVEPARRGRAPAPARRSRGTRCASSSRAPSGSRTVRSADDLDGQEQIARHAADDEELLVVLLAEDRDARADDGEELGDDRRDALEVARARAPAERLGERARRARASLRPAG